MNGRHVAPRRHAYSLPHSAVRASALATAASVALAAALIVWAVAMVTWMITTWTAPRAVRAARFAGRIAAAGARWVWPHIARHLYAQDLTALAMALTYPVVLAAGELGIIPDRDSYKWATWAGTVTVCGAIIFWLRVRAQSRWRARGGEMKPGGVTAAESRIALLEQRFEALAEVIKLQHTYAGVPAPADLGIESPVRAMHLRLVPADDSSVA